MDDKKPPKDFIEALNEQEAVKKKDQDKKDQIAAINKAGIKNVEATNRTTDAVNKGTKDIKGKVEVTNPDLAKTPDIDQVVTSIKEMNLTTFMNSNGYRDMAANMQVLANEVQTLQQKFKEEGLTTLSDSFTALIQRIENIAKELSATKVTVDKGFAKTLINLQQSIDKIDFNPTVNVKSPDTKVVTTPIDLSPVTKALYEVENAVSSQKIPDNKIDLSPVTDGLASVQSAINNQRFPVPNYVLPFKDSTGKAVQVQLDTSGNVPTSGGSGGGTVSQTATTDAAPATQNITARDVSSVTTTAANGQPSTIGTPTAGSVASFAVSGYASARLEVTGIWTGTLVAQVSLDGGTIWYNQGVHQSGTAYTAGSFTSNFAGTTNASGVTNWRLQSTTAWTGTAIVKVVASVNPSSVYVANNLHLSDGVVQSTVATVKPASTPPVAADTSLVVAMSPNSISTTLNSELPDVTGTFTNATQTTAIQATGLNGYDNVFVSISGTYTAATATFQGSDDGGATWKNIAVAARTDSQTIESGYTNLSSIGRGWNINIQGFDAFQVLSSAVATGTVNVRISPESAPTNAGATVGVASFGDGINNGNIVPGDAGFNGVVTGSANKTIPFTTSVAGAQELLADTDIRGYSKVTLVYTSVGSGLAGLIQFSPNSGGTYITTPSFVARNSASSTSTNSGTTVNVFYDSQAIGDFLRLHITALTSGTVSGYVILSNEPWSYTATLAIQSGAYSVGSNTPTGSAVPANAFYVGLQNSGGNLQGLSANNTADAFSGSSNLGTNSFVYNGASFDRLRSATAAANTTGTGLLGVGNLMFDQTNWQPLNNVIGATATASTVSKQLAVGTFSYNGATGDMLRNNTTVSVVAAGTTSTQTNIALTTYNANKLIILVNVSAVTGGTVTVTINGTSSSSYQYPLLTSTALGSVAVTPLRVFPGATPSANAVANDVVPRNVQITATVSGTITFGIDAVLGV